MNISTGDPTGQEEEKQPQPPFLPGSDISNVIGETLLDVIMSSIHTIDVRPQFT